MTGADIVAEARRWIGVRYRHQGRDRDGVDCIGLPVVVRAALGLPVLDGAGYARRDVGADMLNFCREHLLELPATGIQPGDLLVQVDDTIRHMAIVADYLHGGLSIIHAFLPNRKVIECRLDERFMATVRGCFRFPEVLA